MSKSLSYRRLRILSQMFGKAVLNGEVPFVEGFEPKNEQYRRDVSESWATRFVEFCYTNRNLEIT